MITYLNGEFLPKESVFISPDDRGFLFGDGVYEFIRCYNGVLFRPIEHLQRLSYSLSQLKIKFDNFEELHLAAKRLIQENKLTVGHASIYIQITRGAAPRSHRFPTENISPTVYMSASLLTPNLENKTNGVKIILMPDIRWARCDIKAITLLPNILAKQEAKEKGAEEAIFVRNGSVTEGSHTCFCGIFNGKLMTSPKSNYILGSITRDVVLGLCKDVDVPVREFPIFVGDLKKADELFIASTSFEITPVIQIDDWVVRDGKPGPITRKLQKAFDDLIQNIE